MRQLLLALPVLLILLTSGCTLPGGFCIPGLTCEQVIIETPDVIVIESLQALPNNVVPSGTINLVAVVSNVADIDAEIKNMDKIYLILYDYCEGLFDIATVNGAEPISKIGKAEFNDKQAVKISLLRGEKQQIEWVLKAKDRSHVPVKTECELKVLALYPYATKSITTLHFIQQVVNRVGC